HNKATVMKAQAVVLTSNAAWIMQGGTYALQSGASSLIALASVALSSSTFMMVDVTVTVADVAAVFVVGTITLQGASTFAVANSQFFGLSQPAIAINKLLAVPDKSSDLSTFQLDGLQLSSHPTSPSATFALLIINNTNLTAPAVVVLQSVSIASRRTMALSFDNISFLNDYNVLLLDNVTATTTSASTAVSLNIIALSGASSQVQLRRVNISLLDAMESSQALNMASAVMSGSGSTIALLQSTFHVMGAPGGEVVDYMTAIRFGVAALSATASLVIAQCSLQVSLAGTVGLPSLSTTSRPTSVLGSGIRAEVMSQGMSAIVNITRNNFSGNAVQSPWDPVTFYQAAPGPTSSFFYSCNAWKDYVNAYQWFPAGSTAQQGGNLECIDPVPSVTSSVSTSQALDATSSRTLMQSSTQKLFMTHSSTQPCQPTLSLTPNSTTTTTLQSGVRVVLGVGDEGDSFAPAWCAALRDAATRSSAAALFVSANATVSI
ncbi:Hypothetical protein, putative, partial [Bodo saltans]